MFCIADWYKLSVFASRHAVVAPLDLHRDQRLQKESSWTAFQLYATKVVQNWLSIPYQLLNYRQLLRVRITSRLRILGKPQNCHHISETRRSKWRIQNNPAAPMVNCECVDPNKTDAQRFDSVLQLKNQGFWSHNTSFKSRTVMLCHITQLPHSIAAANISIFGN